MHYNAEVIGLDASGFPGRLSVVIAFYGCKLGCLFCNSQFTEDTHNQKSLTDVLSEIDQYSEVAKGVILTGGEPTDQEIFPLVSSIKSSGYDVKLETHGYNSHVIGKLAHSNLVDYLSFGLKSFPRFNPFSNFVPGLPGDYLDRVMKSLAFSRHVEKEISYLVIPGVTDKPEIVSDASLIAKRYNARLVLEEFDPEGASLDKSRPDYGSLISLAEHSLAETWLKTRREGYIFVHPESEVFF